MATPYRQFHWLYLCFVNSWLMLAPSFLCADWTMGTVPLIDTLTDPRNLATVATFISITALGLYAISGSKKSHKIVIFALALIVFPYIPASNLFFPVGFVVAERILYVPSMGFSMLVTFGLWQVIQRSPKFDTMMTIVVGFLLLSHSAKTLSRNRDWISDVSLFTSAIRINPHNGKLYNNLGHEYERLDNLTQAEELFRTASVKQPDDVGAFINLGRVLKAQTRLEEAEEVVNPRTVVVSLLRK